MFDQANRIIRKFGGARRLAAVLRYEPSRVYKWTYSREKGGTGGLVPAASVTAIQAAADLQGIALTDSDWAPT